MFEEKTKISNVAMNILRKRYFMEREKTWNDVTNRVIDFVLSDCGDKEQKELTREMILNRYFIPNSPCLVNSGKPKSGLLACFVVDFPDTIEGIYKTKLDFALIARKGGGCGTTLSNIRPEGSRVSGSTHGYAGGPVKFADTISHDMDALTQAGFRSMAIMLTMSIFHPDIIKFILAKTEEGKLANANISVTVNNAFMEKVEKDEEYQTHFNHLPGPKYKARDIFNMIVEGAWKNGELGILFYERINDSPYKYSNQEILATNPCSEQPLPPSGCCNLGSLDLTKFLTKEKVLDLNKLETAVRLSVKFLNRVILKTEYPTPEIEKWSLDNAPIGLGVMGFADYLLHKEIAYGSQESLNEIEFIMDFIYKIAEDESISLGEKFGIPIENQKLPVQRRNITLTTIAPTGTISLIAGCVIGATEIHTIAGKKKIKDIVGTEQCVYCSGEDEILVRRAHNIRKTGEMMEVWKIRFDTDDELILTPDHRVMLGDGTWKRTDELKFGDSVREFHKSIWSSNTTTTFPSTALYMTNLPRKFNHVAIAECKFGRKRKNSEEIHHIDLDHSNDDPDNLIIIPKTEHNSIHSSSLVSWSKSNIGKTYEEIFGEEKAKEIKNVKSIQMSGKGNHRFGYKLTDAEKKLVSERTKEALSRPEVREKYLLGMKNRSRKNHRVMFVELYGYEDVYNMEVDEAENYVANGVLIHNCSSGIEPIFSDIVIRNDKTGSYTFENYLSTKPYFRCAVSANGVPEVTWMEHLQMLNSAQRFVDSGVSKTINCPTGTHRDTIYDIFMTAWKLPYIKGLTVYRNGSRKIEVLSPKLLRKDLCPKCTSPVQIIDNKKKCTNPECDFLYID